MLIVKIYHRHELKGEVINTQAYLPTMTHFAQTNSMLILEA